MEDTDAARSTEESRNAIIASLAWLGLSPDEPVVMQSQLDYSQVVDSLAASGLCYWCDCAPQRLEETRNAAGKQGALQHYDGHCRERGLSQTSATVLRINVAKTHKEEHLSWTDLVFGDIAVPASQIGDLVLVRSGGAPTYNFAVVADDLRMKITHVVRGDDHIANTPKQLLVYAALGQEPPRFAHLPLLRNTGGGRLSKRDGAKGVLEYAAEGVSAQALRGYLAGLGWTHEDCSQVELGDLRKLAQVFDISQVHKSPAMFNEDKLLSVNHDWLVLKSESGEIVAEIKTYLQTYTQSCDFPVLGKHLNEPNSKFHNLADLVACYGLRCSTLRQLAERLEAFLGLETAKIDKHLAAQHISSPQSRQTLVEIAARLADLKNANDWHKETISAALQERARQLGTGFRPVGMAVRTALTGQKSSPDLPSLIHALGAQQAAQRLTEAGEAGL